MRYFAIVVVIALLAAAFASAEQTGPRRRVIAADYSKDRKHIAIVDADGKIVWKHPIRNIHDVHQLDNGHILFQTDWTEILELDPATGRIMWRYDAKTNGNEDRRVEVHAFQRLPGGRTMIAESGPSRIIEVDRDGRIVHEMKLQVAKADAHRDTRNVRKLAGGNYLVAHESEGAVREYDPSGKVVWEYTVPLFGKERKGGHAAEAWGNAVYSAIRLPNGNTLIGAGNGHSVLEVTPGKEIVWAIHQDDLSGVKLAWVTQVSRLANGNTVIVNCHAGPDQPQILEVTPGKKVVWSFHDFKNFGDATPVALVLDAGEYLAR